MASFFTWLAQLPPLLQVPIVIIAFLAVVALIVYFVELAPRPGTKYTVLRLVVCIAVPVALVFILGTYTWAAIVAIVLGALLFWLDHRSREGAGYLIGLIGSSHQRWSSSSSV